jgi:hypothetical protein
MQIKLDLSDNQSSNNQSYRELIRTKNKSNWLTQLQRKFKLTNTDLTVMLILAGGSVYMSFTEPFLSCLILATFLFYYCASNLLNLVPKINKRLGLQIKLWHLVVLIFTVVSLLSIFDAHAHAFFLSNLETFVKGLADDQEVSDDMITAIFNAIRAIFLVLVAVAALFAYNQAQQGNDWRPIATQVGMAFGIVISIDVITRLFTNV